MSVPVSVLVRKSRKRYVSCIEGQLLRRSGIKKVSYWVYFGAPKGSSNRGRVQVIAPAEAHVRGNAVEREARAKAESGRNSRDVGSGGARRVRKVKGR